MLRILILSLNAALLQGIPVAQVDQIPREKDKATNDVISPLTTTH